MSRSVRWRSGRSRAPPESSCSRRSNRSSSASGENSLTLAAASSMASGSPSSRRQISSTVEAFAAVSSKAGATATARSQKSRTAGESRSPKKSGGTGNCRSPMSRSGALLVASTVRRGHSPTRSATKGAAGRRCSRLSISNSSLHLLQVPGKGIHQRRARRVFDPERLGEDRGDEIRILQRRQGYEGDTVGESRPGAPGHLQGQPGLAHASRTRQGQKPHVVATQEGRNVLHLVFAPDKRRRGHGKGATGRLGSGAANGGPPGRRLELGEIRAPPVAAPRPASARCRRAGAAASRARAGLWPGA